MKNSFIKYLEKPVLNEPILIVGLPGVGDIGKLVAQYLINELAIRKIGILYSPYFPYHVVISNDGIIRLLNNEFFYFKSKKEMSDLIILSGDFQSQTIFGQYEIAGLIIEFCKEFNVKKIITIGGYVIGNFKEQPKVFGAINNPNLKNWIKELSVELCDIGSPIVGAAGIILGLANLNEIDGICLLGETPGFISDAKAASTILKRIILFLNLDLDVSKLEGEDQKIKEKIEKIQEIEKQMGLIKRFKEKLFPNNENLSYFG